MVNTLKTVDPKGLIYEAYRIEGITLGQCRSIFLDWAINVPADADTQDFIRACLAEYADTAPEHPMTQTLQAGLNPAQQTGRRGGRAARIKA
ncbi:MAG: hypothetical protein ACWA40_05935 [Planktomarina sp.]